MMMLSLLEISRPSLRQTYVEQDETVIDDEPLVTELCQQQLSLYITCISRTFRYQELLRSYTAQ